MIRNEVSRWMWDMGISRKEISNATGASKASVSMTIKGTRNDKRVLDYLQQRGCPYLYTEARKIRKPSKSPDSNPSKNHKGVPGL